jgi:adenosylcobinamide amidohydrolase
MIQEMLADGILLEQTNRHTHIQFDRPHSIISSAVLNGGAVCARHILNLKVDKTTQDDSDAQKPPEITLAEYSRHHGWSGTTVGMMTAASMDSLRMVQAIEQGVHIFVIATTGLSNARSAGDIAEHREIGRPVSETGTINLICLTTACLTPAAMIESVITATEAKIVALGKLGIKSPVSEKPATGTGTDAIVIASGRGPVEVQYCGKHVIFGEILANQVIDAVTSSLAGNGRFQGSAQPPTKQAASQIEKN